MLHVKVTCLQESTNFQNNIRNNSWIYFSGTLYFNTFIFNTIMHI